MRLEKKIPILVLRLEGVLQSWGEHSKWDYRDSASLPTKSGIVGLIGCAMGLERGEKRLVELSEALHLAVRADRSGREVTDFHTVQSKNLLNAQGKHRGKQGEYSTLVTYRTYLQDACFTVAMTGEKSLLEEIEQALWHPKWPVYLGRKSCVPSRPVCDGLTEEYESLVQAMYGIPLAKEHLYDDRDSVLVEYEDVQEADGGTTMERQDRLAGARYFRSRTVMRKAHAREQEGKG